MWTHVRATERGIDQYAVSVCLYASFFVIICGPTGPNIATMIFKRLNVCALATQLIQPMWSSQRDRTRTYVHVHTTMPVSRQSSHAHSALRTFRLTLCEFWLVSSEPVFHIALQSVSFFIEKSLINQPTTRNCRWMSASRRDESRDESKRKKIISLSFFKHTETHESMLVLCRCRL